MSEEPVRASRPQKGDFGLSRGTGLGAALIRVGLLLNGDRSRFSHAFVLVGDDEVVEAVSSGARVASLASYLRAPDRVLFSAIPLSSDQRDRIAREAVGLVGTPYGWLDFAALALTRLGLPSRRVRQRVTESGHMICSQLVDQAYLRAGVHLFDDGRLSQDVTPGDLYALLDENGWIREGSTVARAVRD